MLATTPAFTCPGKKWQTNPTPETLNAQIEKDQYKAIKSPVRPASL
jgi:hypothetical protein